MAIPLTHPVGQKGCDKLKNSASWNYPVPFQYATRREGGGSQCTLGTDTPLLWSGLKGYKSWQTV